MYAPTSWHTWLIVLGCEVRWPAQASIVGLDLAELRRYIGIIGDQRADCERGQLRGVSNEATRYFTRVEVPLLV